MSLTFTSFKTAGLANVYPLISLGSLMNFSSLSEISEIFSVIESMSSSAAPSESTLTECKDLFNKQHNAHTDSLATGHFLWNSDLSGSYDPLGDTG